MPPSVSVILPTYNRASLLPRAVQSVLVQGYQDLELIIIDDGSADGTPEVVASSGDSRIRYVRFEQNRGIGAARHEGVSRAQGEFIAFIDSDDIWLPGKLELQTHLFRKHTQFEVIFSNFLNVNHVDGNRELGFRQNQVGLAQLQVRQLETGVREISSGLHQAILGSNFISPSTVMLKADVVYRAGNFDPSLSGPEDFEFWWRLAAHGAQFAYTEQPLIERHKDSQSITSQTIRFAQQKLRALELCEQTSRQCGQDYLLPALRRARHRTWCGLIRAHALQGERKAALRSFAQSMRYGVSQQAFMYIAAALAGPAAIDQAKRMRRAFTKSEQTS